MDVSTIEDAILVNPEEEQPLEELDTAYYTVAQIPIVGGIVYIAVKHGYTMESKPSKSLADVGMMFVEVTVNNSQGDFVEAFVFGATFELATEYFLNKKTIGVDIEIEPMNIPYFDKKKVGFRKPKQVSSTTEGKNVTQYLENKKKSNRNARKKAALSKKKNRK
jgi:hypothetical protein